MSNRVIPAASKMVSFSDLTPCGIATMTVKDQHGATVTSKFSIAEMRYIYSRIEAVLAKFAEDNAAA